MFVLYYSNAKYLFLQMRNGLFEDSCVLGGLSPLVTPPSLLVQTLKTSKHPYDIIEVHCSALSLSPPQSEGNTDSVLV